MKVDGEGNPVSNVADALTTKPESKNQNGVKLASTPITKPTVICAKPARIHVQVFMSKVLLVHNFNRRYRIQLDFRL